MFLLDTEYQGLLLLDVLLFKLFTDRITKIPKEAYSNRDADVRMDVWTWRGVERGGWDDLGEWH